MNIKTKQDLVLILSKFYSNNKLNLAHAFCNMNVLWFASDLIKSNLYLDNFDLLIHPINSSNSKLLTYCVGSMLHDNYNEFYIASTDLLKFFAHKSYKAVIIADEVENLEQIKEIFFHCEEYQIFPIQLVSLIKKSNDILDEVQKLYPNLKITNILDLRDVNK